jgi:hypothetical protein
VHAIETDSKCSGSKVREFAIAVTEGYGAPPSSNPAVRSASDPKAPALAPLPSIASATAQTERRAAILAAKLAHAADAHLPHSTPCQDFLRASKFALQSQDFTWDASS